MRNLDPFKGMGARPFAPKDDGQFVFEKGHEFDDVYHYRRVLRDYTVKGGFILKWKKNDFDRVTVLYNGK